MAQIKINSQFVWRYPSLSELVVTDNYSADLGALFLGTHRLAGDLAYIQFLQYYGQEETNEESQKLPEYVRESGAGHYPLTLEYGTRILRLDPFFNASILEIAGALAFNLNKPQESLTFLAEAIQKDPTFHRYRLYIAAILYKNESKDASLITMLEQDIKYRDCPVLLQMVLGNLLKKNKLYLRAAYVYRHVLETAPQESDRDTAARRLKDLIFEHPESKGALEGQGLY